VSIGGQAAACQPMEMDVAGLERSQRIYLNNTAGQVLTSRAYIDNLCADRPNYSPQIEHFENCGIIWATAIQLGRYTPR
jgi:hypothetical protein